jgi:hypothetical protein
VWGRRRGKRLEERMIYAKMGNFTRNFNDRTSSIFIFLKRKATAILRFCN